MQSSIFIGKEIEPETRNWLTKEKIDFKEDSFFEIVFNGENTRFFEYLKNSKKIFVTTSNWAVKWMIQNCKKLSIQSTDSVYCLSYKQASLCARLFRNFFIAPERNVNALADLVLEKEKDEIIVYLKGNKSMKKMENRLGHLGVRFQELEVYKNIPLIKRIDSDYGIYIFFSPSGVMNFYKSGNEIRNSAKIVAIGSTTAKKCQEIFRKQIFVSPVQEELATIKYAANMLKTFS